MPALVPVQAAKSPPIWIPLTEKDMALVKDWKKPGRATEVGFFRLDIAALRKQIDLAPMDDEPDWQAKRRLIYFPLPDGTFYPVLISRFKTNIKGAPGSSFCPIRGINPEEPSIEARGFVNRDGIDFRITFKNKTCYFTHPKLDDRSIVASACIESKCDRR